MKVRATQIGYYAVGDNPANHRRMYPAEYAHKPGAGEPFELDRPQLFTPSWMEVVSATPEEMKIVNAKIEHMKNLRERGAVPIVMNSFGAPAEAPGVKVRSNEPKVKKGMHKKATPEAISHKEEESI